MLSEPTTLLAGVGPTVAAKLRRAGMTNVGELLDAFPRRYDLEAGESAALDALSDGVIHTARGKVVAVDVGYGRRSRFEATLEKDGQRLSLVWFNGTWLRSKITPGCTLRVRGKVGRYHNMPQMSNPKWEVLAEGEENEEAPPSASKLRPIYPATGELPSSAVEKAVSAAIDAGAIGQIPELFDDAFLKRRGLPQRGAAYLAMHRPESQHAADLARRRMVYDELMLLQLGLALARRARDEGRLGAAVVKLDKTLDERIRARFPFALTGAQQSAAWEIAADMKSGRPMNRLLQGDVGSGKTVVALYAMLAAIANKLQATLLAPTEVLAEQHYLSLSRFMHGSGVRIELFTGRSKRADRQRLADLAEGRAHLAVGTQALLQGDVDFANLGLVVVDEQHKLGVKQRATLRGKGLAPHYLVMTATPIPRTLALSFFADFDVTTIHELPPGRQPIVTKWLPPQQADRAYAQVRAAVKDGRQAYVVVPRIEADELEDVASLEKRFAELSEKELSGLRLEQLSGRMDADAKAGAMERFRSGQADVLVATTVIEVGVDVPNATVMVIESAEQFGLAQLHQLRGRVGRGSEASQCLLISEAPTDDARQRLQVMCKTTDGFEIAEADLQLRGPGDFFGTRQSGLPPLKIADLSQELEMLSACRDDATELLRGDPTLALPVHAALRHALVDRFGESLPLAGVG